MYPDVPSTAPGSVAAIVAPSTEASPPMARQAEVQDLHAAIAGDEEVLRLEIAVDDPLLVRRGQAAGDLDCVVQGLAHGQRSPLQPLPQGLALDQLRDEKGRPLVVAKVVDREDVRVVQAARGAGLLLEAPQAIRVGPQALRQDLDNHVATEPLIVGQEDFSHPAAPQRLQDAKVSKVLWKCRR
jgi:hypothetical protein